MSIFYSAATGGFYISGVSASIPAGAVEITEAEHQGLLEGQANGKIIVASNGVPTLSDPPVESVEAWRARCEVTKRQALLSLYAMDNGQTLETIKAAVLAAGGLTQIDWETASTFKRMNSTVLAIQQVMGWTDEQLDNLFKAAEQVPT